MSVYESCDTVLDRCDAFPMRDEIGNIQGEGREGVETAIHRASPSVMRASRGVRRSNCKQIWLRVHDPSEVDLVQVRLLGERGETDLDTSQHFDCH